MEQEFTVSRTAGVLSSSKTRRWTMEPGNASTLD